MPPRSPWEVAEHSSHFHSPCLPFSCPPKLTRYPPSYEDTIWRLTEKSKIFTKAYIFLFAFIYKPPNGVPRQMRGRTIAEAVSNPERGATHLPCAVFTRNKKSPRNQVHGYVAAEREEDLDTISDSLSAPTWTVLENKVLRWEETMGHCLDL